MDTSLAEQVYAAAAGTGLLKPCYRLTTEGHTYNKTWVGFKASDDSVLHNLAMSNETTLTYPASVFTDLKKGDRLEIERVRYQVREIRAIGDGSEMQVKVAKL